MFALRSHWCRSRSESLRRPSSFSLPEMLVVVGIVVILLGILLPSIHKSMRQTSATICMHNLHDLYGALHAYRMDNRGWLPATQSDPGDPYSAAWFGPLLPNYIPDTSKLICPDDPARRWLGKWGSLSRHPTPANASSYGLNDLLSVGSWGNLDRAVPRRPVETILLADMGPDYVSARTGRDVAAEVVHRSGGRLPWDDGYRPGQAEAAYPWLTRRHLNGINVLTIGGAVKAVETRDAMRFPIKKFYVDCAGGGCPLCRDVGVTHYSFATDRVFWWTGPLPQTQ